MNKQLVIGLIAVLVVVIGGTGVFVAQRGNDNTDASTVSDSTMEKKDEIAQDAMKKEESEVMEKTDDQAHSETDAMKKDDVMVKEEPAAEAAMAKPSSYVTLADYNKDPNIYSGQKKVYFFHASWCPICQSIDEDISADTSQIPSGTTFIKTDYDSNTALRQQYGVTYQYTFVQVDNSGNELKQWSATNLDKAIAGIQ